MNKIRVLVFPAGEINSIELHDALAYCVNIEVYGASSIDRHGPYVFENYISGLPLINNPSFFESFNSVLQENNIDVVFPTHDTVANFFAMNLDRIKAKVVVADKNTAAICRDKGETYKVFADCDFVPKTFEEVTDFPVFVKPREGQGSVGARLIENPSQIPNDCTDLVFCEYLPGKEYTVDCFTGKNGELLFVSPRSRLRTMAGVSVAGQIEELTTEINQIAKTINERLSFLGLWWFQIKQDKAGHWKLLEVSTRCAGTMALTRARGVNLPLLSVYVAMGYEVDVSPNQYHVKMDSTLIRRYRIDYAYDKVYFDFDDTLTLRGKVNLKAIWFLYQCRNQGKKVILLTKHSAEILDTMRNYCIDRGLFDEIIHIAPSEKKSSFIAPKFAIFVDNAWQERNDVSRVHSIPVFDVDGLDVLMDWRV